MMLVFNYSVKMACLYFIQRRLVTYHQPTDQHEHVADTAPSDSRPLRHAPFSNTSATPLHPRDHPPTYPYTMRDSSRVSAVGSPTDQVRSSAKAIALHSPSDVRINIQACHSAAAFLAATNSTKHRNPSTIASSWLGANGLHPTIPDTAALSW